MTSYDVSWTLSRLTNIVTIPYIYLYICYAGTQSLVRTKEIYILKINFCQAKSFMLKESNVHSNVKC